MELPVSALRFQRDDNCAMTFECARS